MLSSLLCLFGCGRNTSFQQVPYYTWQIVLRHRVASIMNLIVHNHGRTRDHMNDASWIENINITPVHVFLAWNAWRNYTVDNTFISASFISRSGILNLFNLNFDLKACILNILEYFCSGYKNPSFKHNCIDFPRTAHAVLRSMLTVALKYWGLHENSVKSKILTSELDRYKWSYSFYSRFTILHAWEEAVLVPNSGGVW